LFVDGRDLHDRCVRAGVREPEPATRATLCQNRGTMNGRAGRNGRATA